MLRCQAAINKCMSSVFARGAERAKGTPNVSNLIKYMWFNFFKLQRRAADSLTYYLFEPDAGSRI